MAYDEKPAGNTDSLCLYGETAKDYMRTGLGTTVKLTVTALVKSMGMGQPGSVEEADTPYVEFEVLDVQGGKKPYSEMSSGEMESEIANVKYEDQPEPPQYAPNIEDGGNIWADTKRQAKVSRVPMRRPKPFRIG